MDGDFWTKKGDSNFDISQGAFDTAEVCDIVGLFLLSELEKLNINSTLVKFCKSSLAVSFATPKQNEINKTEICKVYKKHPKYHCSSKQTDCDIPRCCF